VAPIILGVAAISFALTVDLWLLTALPFIALGSVRSAPNFNLEDAFPVVLSVIIGLTIAAWAFMPVGIAIFTGSAAGWICGSIEKTVRVKIYTYKDRKEDDQWGIGN